MLLMLVCVCMCIYGERERVAAILDSCRRTKSCSILKAVSFCGLLAIRDWFRVLSVFRSSVYRKA